MSASLSRSDRIRVCIMVALAGLSLATRLFAQEEVRSLSTGTHVKVSSSAPRLDRVPGVLVRNTPDSIQVVIGSPFSADTISIPLHAITTLQIRRSAGNQAGKGAGIGALAGLGLGLMAVATERGCTRQSFCFQPSPVAVVFGGATLGAGIGALIGRAMPRYKWDNVAAGRGAPLAIVSAPDGSGVGVRIPFPALR